MKEHLLRAHFNLPSVIAEDPDGKPPIYVRFEIPYYTVSGLQVSLRFCSMINGWGSVIIFVIFFVMVELEIPILLTEKDLSGH